MARPLRIEFPGAVYHVATRGDAAVFADDEDRSLLLELLDQAVQRFDAQVLAYGEGENHYELLIFTRQANLSRLMRHLNGVYTQAYNRRHGRTGHVFQGRFKAVLVDREHLLLDACRYVELVGVRTGLVGDAADWPWSSFLAHAGMASSPDWLEVEGLWGHVLGKQPQNAADRRKAGQRYYGMVESEPELDIWGQLRHQIFLGDAAFVQRTVRLSERVPRAPRPRGLREWLRNSGSREEALYRAHTEGGQSMTALARELGLSVSRVSRLIAGHERGHREMGRSH
ncbi:REP element-mobilizing transposase RayT [Roseateles sp. YR242]|uniref:transposase n=1 Tax=Roseateles sp. YR242 TaxID=1855305 RepID=UPI0008C423E7|nr:transposase [Roseateles sp. YR242]SEK65568.1 REP element-mobilizing transposase RayT [Roseateles sp. YR242]